MTVIIVEADSSNYDTHSPSDSIALARPPVPPFNTWFNVHYLMGGVAHTFEKECFKFDVMPAYSHPHPHPHCHWHSHSHSF